jgi:trans-2,3-dihydro-3-hydroxyanthranilate isomerase
MAYNRTMKRRFVTADVFTDQQFGGNPLAVVLDAAGLSTAQMQAVAREFNYSETTFVLPPREPRHTAQVRIFTPRVEVPFAGHPNVGTAFVLARERALRGEPNALQFTFEEAAGLVPITLLQEQAVTVGAELRAPESLSRRGIVSAEAAAGCLSLAASDVATALHAPQVVSVGLPFLVVELQTRDALRRSRGNVAAHEALLPLDGADCVFAYVREPAAATRAEGDVAPTVLHARMFAPLDGVPEDPATGSATAATIALLSAIDHNVPGERRWRIHQGVDMGRPSLLLGRTITADGAAAQTHVGGRCVAVMEGTIDL